MKIAVLSRSDSNGGAAIVSRRLTEALRGEGAEATLVTADAFPLLKPIPFAAERLQAAFNISERSNLWKIDTGRFGLPFSRLRAVKEADAVILNYINQGTLPLSEIRRLAAQGKKIIWTMHDMWPMTGVCHHAIDCRRFEGDCNRCPLLRARSQLARRVHARKARLYGEAGIRFVAVSRWLERQARDSSLLAGLPLSVIPNPFRPAAAARGAGGPARILFPAATIDNWIKGLDTFKAALHLLAARNSEGPGSAAPTPEIILMGAVKDPRALEGFPFNLRHLGHVSGEENIAAVYASADVTVNSSLFENLPGTLIEAQAYGSIPVAFDRGGQRDIIDHGATGFLSPWHDDPAQRAASLAGAIAAALDTAAQASAGAFRERMRASVEDRFSYHAVAASYLAFLRF